MKKFDIPFRYGKIDEMDNGNDIAYWLTQSDEAKFNEAWRLVEQAYQIKGISLDELRFQRSVASLQRQES